VHNKLIIFLIALNQGKKIELMENSLKNFLYAGIGLASMTSEKVKSSVNELVEKGKISDTEAKKIVDDVFENLNGKAEDFEDKLGEVIKKVADKLNYVKRDNYENLLKRVKDLEAEVAKSKDRKTTVSK